MTATMRSLPETSHEHQERILPHVDRLRELAEMVGHAPRDVLAAGLDEECRFVHRELLPHIEAIETTLYGRLEALMEGRHSMAPMRLEHARLRALVASLDRYSGIVAEGDFSRTAEIGLRRVLYRLFAMLKVHLAEEDLYLGVLDRNLTAEEKDQLARGIDHALAEPL